MHVTVVVTIFTEYYVSVVVCIPLIVNLENWPQTKTQGIERSTLSNSHIGVLHGLGIEFSSILRCQTFVYRILLVPIQVCFIVKLASASQLRVLL